MRRFGNSENRDPAHVTLVRAWVTELLPVTEDAFVMVKQMECLEQGCPPVETVIAILSDLSGPRQWKLFKPLSEITREDIEYLSESSGHWTPQEWRCPD